MSLDLRNFVNVNINYNTIKLSSVSSGIVTLITANTEYSDNPYEGKIFRSFSEYETAKEEEEISDTSLDDCVECFFVNKGKALQIIGGYSSGSKITFAVNVLKGLNYRHVLIVSDLEEEELRAVAQTVSKTNIAPNAIQNQSTVDTFSGLNEKIFIGSTTDKSGKFYNHLVGDSAPTFALNKYYELTSGQYVLLASEPADWSTDWASYYEVAPSTATEISNYLIKVGSKGIEMAAAAYFSKINTQDSNTINDYAFTIETLKSAEGFDFESSIISDNATGVNLINSHFNFNTILANAVRNYPGDGVTGIDMVNYYVRILLIQDLTEAIMNLLSSKIKFNQEGVNRLNNAISQQMATYINNGYLNTDFIWTEEDLYYSFNGEDYLICSRNTPLVKGYRSVILPLTSLTAAQREAHVLPPVYILLADQTGIRQVVIEGDVY